MDLAKPVWAENADLAQAALEHPFVQVHWLLGKSVQK
jgi:hypothetical protein